jgi:hypothetical protein
MAYINSLLSLHPSSVSMFTHYELRLWGIIRSFRADSKIPYLLCTFVVRVLQRIAQSCQTWSMRIYIGVLNKSNIENHPTRWAWIAWRRKDH